MYPILSFISILCLTLSEYIGEQYIFDIDTLYPNGIQPFEETRAVKSINTLGFCASKCALFHGCKSFEICPIRSANICRLMSCNSSLVKKVIDVGITCRRFKMKGNNIKKKDDETDFDNATNVALNKSTWTSSTFDSHEHRGSHFAVDGLLSFMLLKFPHTDYENSPWLKIDLEKVYLIRKVVVFNRADAAGDRLRNLVIKTGPSLTSFPFVCGTFKGPGKTGQVIEILCNLCSIAGRFVLLQIDGNPGEKDYFHVNEVEVFATRKG